MTNLTQVEAMKEVRLEAKNNGMVFKRQNATINGVQAYQFTNRKTGIVVMSNYTLWSAYEDMLNGYISSNKQS